MNTYILLLSIFFHDKWYNQSWIDIAPVHNEVLISCIATHNLISMIEHLTIFPYRESISHMEPNWENMNDTEVRDFIQNYTAELFCMKLIVIFQGSSVRKKN